MQPDKLVDIVGKLVTELGYTPVSARISGKKDDPSIFRVEVLVVEGVVEESEGVKVIDEADIQLFLGFIRVQETETGEVVTMISAVTQVEA
jgi:hypothetical protein